MFINQIKLLILTCHSNIFEQRRLRDVGEEFRQKSSIQEILVVVSGSLLCRQIALFLCELIFPFLNCSNL